jgi:hypothetical protein
VKIGQPDRWWNRRVPIARIGLIVVVALVSFYFWVFYGDLIGNVLWGVRYQRTASFRGQTLQVPWFWREEEWTNYNEFDLSRASRDPRLFSSVTITYENITPSDAQRRVELMRHQFTQLPQMSRVSGYFYGNYESDDFSRAQYLCLDQGFKWSPNLRVTCFSRDGRWRVAMFGSNQTRSEFEIILHGVASMGNPTK